MRKPCDWRVRSRQGDAGRDRAGRRWSRCAGRQLTTLTKVGQGTVPCPILGRGTVPCPSLLVHWPGGEAPCGMTDARNWRPSKSSSCADPSSTHRPLPLPFRISRNAIAASRRSPFRFGVPLRLPRFRPCYLKAPCLLDAKDSLRRKQVNPPPLHPCGRAPSRPRPAGPGRATLVPLRGPPTDNPDKSAEKPLGEQFFGTNVRLSGLRGCRVRPAAQAYHHCVAPVSSEQARLDPPLLVVRAEGLEPSRPRAPEPKSGASTNSATRAMPVSVATEGTTSTVSRCQAGGAASLRGLLP